jgi:hypothetical protein
MVKGSKKTIKKGGSFLVQIDEDEDAESNDEPNTENAYLRKNTPAPVLV